MKALKLVGGMGRLWMTSLGQKYSQEDYDPRDQNSSSDSSLTPNCPFTSLVFSFLTRIWGDLVLFNFFHKLFVRNKLDSMYMK